MAGAAGAKGPKVVVLTLVDNMPLPTNGVNSTWTYLELPGSPVFDFGPHLESITPHTNTKNASGAHEWKVVLLISYDGLEWPTSPSADLFASIQAGSGYAIQTPFTDTTKFGLKVKFMLAVKNVTGTAVNSALVGCKLALKFLS